MIAFEIGCCGFVFLFFFFVVVFFQLGYLVTKLFHGCRDLIQKVSHSIKTCSCCWGPFLLCCCWGPCLLLLLGSLFVLLLFGPFLLLLVSLFVLLLLSLLEREAGSKPFGGSFDTLGERGESDVRGGRAL